MKRRFVGLLAVTSCLVVSAAHASSLHHAGNAVGSTYNQVLKKTDKREVSLSVGSAVGRWVVELDVETGAGTASVLLPYSYATSKLEAVLTKATEWSKIANDNSADITKALGCFWEPFFNQSGAETCESEGVPVWEGQAGMRFMATNGGRDTGVIISIRDRSNRYVTSDVYLDMVGVTQLIDAVQKLPAAFEKAKAEEKNSKLFQ